MSRFYRQLILKYSLSIRSIWRDFQQTSSSTIFDGLNFRAKTLNSLKCPLLLVKIHLTFSRQNDLFSVISHKFMSIAKSLELVRCWRLHSLLYHCLVKQWVLRHFWWNWRKISKRSWVFEKPYLNFLKRHLFSNFHLSQKS